MAVWRDMRLSTALGPWTAAFFTSLGLTPLVACGGTTVDRTDSNGAGGDVSSNGGSAGSVGPGTGGYG
ncbi:MAG TPA: hypothetical protein VF395_13380, partial [Polyangiaceae bacterium]